MNINVKELATRLCKEEVLYKDVDVNYVGMDYIYAYKFDNNLDSWMYENAEMHDTREDKSTPPKDINDFHITGLPLETILKLEYTQRGEELFWKRYDKIYNKIMEFTN